MPECCLLPGEKYHFSKTQEILGQDMYEGLKILESIK